jgi:hypothetical protein
MATKKKEKPKPIDGLSPKDIAKIRTAIRKVWHWSVPRKLCMKRATRPDGFSQCEKCKKKVPKVFIDHKIAVGLVDGGFIDRLFCPSKGLQALCKTCHGAKTRDERAELREF